MSAEPRADTRGYNSLPLPFGWFAVAASGEVAPGQVKTVRYFNTELVVWRGEDGKPRALDPYCRHLGAHLGQGAVIGDDLRCPFHHWSYNGEGAVTDIPYAKAIPPKLRKSCMPSWPVEEALGQIFVWYHPHKAEPMWSLATVPELLDEHWVQFDTQEWTINTHIQEITENGMDYAHFRAVHDTKSPPIPTYKIEEFSREGVVEAKMETPRGLVDGRIHTRATGPGQSFTRFHGISDILQVQMQTAVSSTTTHLRQQFYHPAGISEGKLRVTHALARNLTFQIKQDIPIWESKRFQPDPILVDGDGPILAYRRQYARYYVDDPHAPPETSAA